MGLENKFDLTEHGPIEDFRRNGAWDCNSIALFYVLKDLAARVNVDLNQSVTCLVLRDDKKEYKWLDTLDDETYDLVTWMPPSSVGARKEYSYQQLIDLYRKRCGRDFSVEDEWCFPYYISERYSEHLNDPFWKGEDEPFEPPEDLEKELQESESWRRTATAR